MVGRPALRIHVTQIRTCLDCGFLTIQGRELSRPHRIMLGTHGTSAVMPANPEQTRCYKRLWDYDLHYFGDTFVGVIEEIERSRDKCPGFALYEPGLTPAQHLEIQLEQRKMGQRPAEAMNERWDETWHRILEWTNSKAQSERLSAQVLLSEGFTSLDPSHPLGGKDGGKDASCTHHGLRWVMASYFPRGQKDFKAIEAKFMGDVDGALANDAQGIAFVTNQELRLAERKALAENAGNLKVEIYHLERMTAILDQPSMASVRKQFLQIGDSSTSPPVVVDKWVSLDYVDKAGITREQGYRFLWAEACRESQRIDLEGWEYAESGQEGGTRFRFKIHDAPEIGGYLVLLKKRDY